MIEIQDKLQMDLEAVRQIPIVPTMLETICQLTEMGFATIARVTEERWLACSVRDQVHFGLKEGDELEIATTLCNEIRDHRQPIVIDNVSEDPCYKEHHTPRIYGLQSYISFPIVLKDGTFFGTLCAIDAKPAKVNDPKVLSTFKMFAELLSFHLESVMALEHSVQTNLELLNQNDMLATANFDLDSFVYTASHDLKSPIANIEGLIELLSEAVSKEEMDRDEITQIADMMKRSLNRFSTTIGDLTAIVEIDKNNADGEPETLNLFEVVESVKQDLDNMITDSDAKIEVIADEEHLTGFSLKNFKSIINNLISNAIKYRSPDRTPHVIVRMEKVDGKTHLSVADNGLGIPTNKQDSIFTLFKRFHDHVDGSGIGLYIVKRMVDNVKGEIKVKSTLNEGTTFTIIY
jgi:signal transduction histidine kinase